MTIDLNEFLPVLLYILLIVLVIVLIVLGIKLIKTTKKVDAVLDEVNEKMGKVDGVFNIIDKPTDYASGISDRIIGAIAGFLTGIVKKKNRKDEEDEDE